MYTPFFELKAYGSEITKFFKALLISSNFLSLTKYLNSKRRTCRFGFLIISSPRGQRLYNHLFFQEHYICYSCTGKKIYCSQTAANYPLQKSLPLLSLIIQVLPQRLLPFGFQLRRKHKARLRLHGLSRSSTQVCPHSTQVKALHPSLQ